MDAEVYFVDASAKGGGPLRKLGRLIEESKILAGISKGDDLAIKTHMGEAGNTTHIRPLFVRKIVDSVKSIGVNPFVTDTTVLYGRRRYTGLGYLGVAAEHGFCSESMNCPIIIADGMNGEDGVVVSEVEVASAIYSADAMVAVSHPTGHPRSGFGGAIKNVGMGCVTKAGKAWQHRVMMPSLDEERCDGCGVCEDLCLPDAIEVEEYAKMDEDKCNGCEQCVFNCPNDAWIPRKENIPEFQRRLAEASSIVLSTFQPSKVCFLNFLLSVTSHCDCFDYSDIPIVQDIGILASFDPVAIDQASLEMINSSLGKSLYEIVKVDYEPQFAHAEKIGLGKRGYKIIEV
jgi:hypothetical protein